MRTLQHSLSPNRMMIAIPTHELTELLVFKLKCIEKHQADDGSWIEYIEELKKDIKFLEEVLNPQLS